MRLASGALHFAKCGRQACVGIDVDVFRRFHHGGKGERRGGPDMRLRGPVCQSGRPSRKIDPCAARAGCAHGKVVEGSLDHPDRPPSALLVVGALEAALNMASCGWVAA